MIANSTKAALASGGAVVGCFFRSPDSTLAEFTALGGWDFLVFDGEHGPLQPGDITDLSRAAQVRGVTPIVRVPASDPPTILRFLDAGALGIHVPNVRSVAEAEQAVRAAKYAPQGIRGLAGNRVSGWRADATTTADANRETMVVVQVETSEAVAAIDDLVAVEGIDVLFIGPTDLSQSLGVPGEIAHPRVREAMDRVAEAVVPSPIALGVFAADPGMAATWRERGARYFATGLEPLLRPAMKAYLDAVKTEEGGT
jgi:4-hydroxy-2-oxoheptanedioate aldolase